MKKIGVVGHRGKLGSLLTRRVDFVPLDCDITHPASIEFAISRLSEPIDLIVNCAGISSIDECELNYKKAVDVNVHGLINLFDVFGKRVLNISSDHIFSGKSWWPPGDNTKPSPINAYGFTKLACEGYTRRFSGKTIRLSRVVSLFDPDIVEYIRLVNNGMEIQVPTFFYRNYIHREFAVDGIEFMAANWDSIKYDTVNYAGTDNFSMYLFMSTLVGNLNMDTDLVKPRDEYKFHTPRPKRGGLNIGLAKKLGFPMHPIADTMSMLVDDYYA